MSTKTLYVIQLISSDGIKLKCAIGGGKVHSCLARIYRKSDILELASPHIENIFRCLLFHRRLGFPSGF